MTRVAIATGASRVPWLTRLYVWSVTLEPLLFFVLFQRNATAVAGNLARALQAVVVLGLGARRILRPRHIRLLRSRLRLYGNYWKYFALAIVSGVIGVATGAFLVPGGYDLRDNSAAAVFLNSATVRPLFEYFIAVYYFVYFTVLPSYFLKSKASVDYLFRVFRTTFVVCLAIGFVDLAGWAFGVHVLPKSLSEPEHVGIRFHGLAGEPRDAFVYLFFGLAMLHLRAFYRRERLGPWWPMIIIVAALATQSFSGLIGVVVFLVLYGLYSLRRLTVKRAAFVLALSTVGVTVIYLSVVSSARLMLYVGAASALWRALESGTAVPAAVSTQMDNIYPLYDLLSKIRNAQWLPVLIGSGLGSASAVNNRFASAGLGLANPNAQLVRTLYESGLIGTIFLVRAFTAPVGYLTAGVPARRRRGFLLLMLLLVGCFFGHRTATVFIYLGVMIAVFASLDRERVVDAPRLLES